MKQEKPTPKRRRRPRPAAAAPGGEPSRWNPATDDLIVAPFSAARPAGKARCKTALQAELGLKLRSRTPLFAYVGELDARHGFDRVLAALPALRKIAAQIVLLAPRRGPLAARAEGLVAEQGDRCLLLIEEDEALLRRLLAGADLLLVPAGDAGADAVAWRGLRYGALPIALASSAVPRLLSAAGSRRRRDVVTEVPGFLFRSPTGLALGRAALKAAEAYGDAVRWRRLRRAGMQVLALPENAEPAPAEPAPEVRLAAPVMTLAETAQRVPAEVVAPAAEPYIDWGPPPPSRYGEDALELLVQSPRRLYGYWEVASQPGLALALQAGLRLVLHDDRREHELSHEARDLGEWWIDAEPGHSYQLELRALDGRALLHSDRVRTPRENASDHQEAHFVQRRASGARRAGVPVGARARSRGAAAAVARRAAGAVAPPPEAPAPAGAPRSAGGGPSAEPSRTAPSQPAPERRAPASEERPRHGREGADYPGASERLPRGKR